MAMPWEMNWGSEAPAAAPAQAQAASAPARAPWEMNWSGEASPQDALRRALPGSMVGPFLTNVAKSLYSGFTYPHDVITGERGVPQSANLPGGENTANIGDVVNLATMASPGAPRAAPSLVKPTTVPTLGALESAVNTGFTAAKKGGIDEINPAGLGRISQDVQTNLFTSLGIDPTAAPRTYNTLRAIERAPPGSTVTFTNLHALRQNLGNIATDAVRSGAGTEAKAARVAQQGLDDYLANIPRSDIARGDPSAAARTLSDAIGNAAAKFRSERVQEIADTARANVEASSSLGQLGRQVKQGVNRFLKSASETRGFSPAEIAQAETVRRSGRLPGIAGAIAQGGGGPLGTLVSGLLTGGVGPAVGAGLRHLESAAVMRQLGKLDEMVRARSPLGQQMGAAAPIPPYAPNTPMWYALRQGYQPLMQAYQPLFFPPQQYQPQQYQ
jgi:hypothetical protein